MNELSQPTAKPHFAAVKNVMNGLANTGREGMVKAVMKCISKWGANSGELVAAFDRGSQSVNDAKSNSPT